MNEFYELIGEGEDQPTPLQMGIRAALVFIIALILIRFSGRRAFGQRSPFDMVIAMLLGAILSRAIVKTDVPFFAPILAAIVICVLHFAFALITTYSQTFGEIIKGRAKILYKDGVKNKKTMRGSFITDRDMKEGIRKAINTDDESQIKEVWLERDGSITVVRNEEKIT
jgi:uncharacterized membrane protein YcaP (DUF421 family)